MTILLETQTLERLLSVKLSVLGEAFCLLLS